ncbi:phage tail assembly protein [Qipengyuania flava]|uniref:phage tail assembly protein n=1 Tax=Qipengyuania flava TaxID=192812 RepID=UPI00273D57E9|nr:phage tail assembly protein [Qipengyuania flava]
MTEQTDKSAGKTYESFDLVQPITRGETTIDKLQLRRPKAGELRGLTLAAIMETDIATTLKLLPRISEPALTDEECADLHPADLAEAGGAIRGFFMTKKETALMEALIAEQRQTT